ncbi:transmembrane protein, putative [Medicago truncatula]|uniref:Transmembrane protein, putative n=1 Tax=Medicago truncatula TaxID=3880 RepID=G7K1N5_MEDTR|nr:transmembrane protein, putative [Medicago truncatula]
MEDLPPYDSGSPRSSPSLPPVVVLRHHYYHFPMGMDDFNGEHPPRSSPSLPPVVPKHHSHFFPRGTHHDHHQGVVFPIIFAVIGAIGFLMFLFWAVQKVIKSLFPPTTAPTPPPPPLPPIEIELQRIEAQLGHNPGDGRYLVEFF